MKRYQEMLLNPITVTYYASPRYTLTSHYLTTLHYIFSTVLASRGDDGSVRVWDIAGQLSQSPKMQTPIKCIPDLMNLYPSANVAFRYGIVLYNVM